MHNIKDIRDNFNNFKEHIKSRNVDINIEEIVGGEPRYNAECFLNMLDGKYKKFQKIIEINAGAALYLSNIAKDLKEGFEIAKKAIDQGVTKKYLNRLIK